MHIFNNTIKTMCSFTTDYYFSPDNLQSGLENSYLLLPSKILYKLSNDFLIEVYLLDYFLQSVIPIIMFLLKQKVRRQNPSITLCPEKKNWKNTTNECFMASNQMMNYHLMILCLLMDILQFLIFMITHQYQIKILHYFGFLCFVTFKPKSMLTNHIIGTFQNSGRNYRPVISEYCTFILSSARIKDKLRLESVQRGFTLHILGADCTLTYNSKCNKLGLDPLWKRGLKLNFIFFFKLLNELSFTSNHVIQYAETSHYDIRNSLALVKQTYS
ncbi:hypothetical protein MS3_00001580 [Schistosoma haematobium]|uniref:Uncharacterized protein n=1 Tax=Schistosoma haematobium TaxID=6185 RepID=A0A6A5DS89_SCHHA|nr:hypothetical protein MS3_00001580 [Schistosoma haematobium]KAH9595592.1 hypothetical protein MS3_00001580 [Schistosoma haematobium]